MNQILPSEWLEDIFHGSKDEANEDEDFKENESSLYADEDDDDENEPNSESELEANQPQTIEISDPKISFHKNDKMAYVNMKPILKNPLFEKTMNDGLKRIGGNDWISVNNKVQ